MTENLITDDLGIGTNNLDEFVKICLSQIKQEADNTFVCNFEGCKKRFNSRKTVKAHINLHIGYKPFKCSVEGCSSGYRRKQHLARHVQQTHEKTVGEFQCTAKGCISSFKTNKSLYQHFRRAHYGTEYDEKKSRFKCPTCEENFPSLNKLQYHKIFKHEMKCPTCSKIFHERSVLKKHEAEHHKNKSRILLKHNCKICNIELPNFQALLKHRKTEEHHKNQKIAWTCEICKKITSNQNHFNAHMETHKPERTIFRCTYIGGCDKYYYFKRNLRQHIKVSHEKQQFICSICSVALCSKQRLNNHMTLYHDPLHIREKKIRKKPTLPKEVIRDNLIKLLTGIDNQEKSTNRSLFKVNKPGRKPGATTKTKSFIENKHPESESESPNPIIQYQPNFNHSPPKVTNSNNKTSSNVSLLSVSPDPKTIVNVKILLENCQKL